MNHLMVDIETFGNNSNSCLVSLAAVQFDIATGETGKRFYMIVDVDTALAVGMKVNASALKFWLEQDHEASKLLFSKEAKSIQHVLHEFRVFLQGLGPAETFLWGNGARFDLGILRDAYNACAREVPWCHRNELDLRTLVFFAPELKAETPFLGVKHNPIDDCLHQITYAVKIYNKIKV